MAEQIIVENEWITIRFEDVDRYVYHTFHKPIGGEPFRVNMDKGIEILHTNQAFKWLSDDRLNGEFTPEDIGWSLNDWGPRAAAAGWKLWALVVPESMAGRAGMQDIVAAFWAMGVKVAVFTQLDEARAWLVKQ